MLWDGRLARRFCTLQLETHRLLCCVISYASLSSRWCSLSETRLVSKQCVLFEFSPTRSVWQRGHTVVARAVQSGSVECLELLCSVGVDVNLAVSPTAGTLLHQAARFGRHIMLVHLLRQKDFCQKLNVEDEDGCTAMMKAVAAGSMECYRALLDAGADCGIKTKTGTTEIHEAARLDDLELLDFLLLQADSASLNAQDKFAGGCFPQ
eukprot:m.35431 g.35431  ORF g.35431 m.35431 type:complete len:208 (-) comp44064_c0_seq5:374-997(-)